jgi:hypothetical protein
MSQQNIPPKSKLTDKQVVSVTGPDGISSTFSYDNETCTLYKREAQVIIPSFHGVTHISSDPVPNATTDTPGLMSPDDKAKLDAITQTRLGILGFSGAGFPDDGGFMQGDIILAAGTELLSIERIGNVVRFTLDMPTQFCGCEECAQIYWIQDETDVAAIRPPSCGGKMPGVNAYGEMKIFLFPESTILNPANPSPTLNLKNNYPALIFKRYDDSITPGAGEFECILTRNTSGTTKVGWAMTPGTTGIPEAVWFMGIDDDGNQIRFDLGVQSEPNLLGALLYKGHSLTRQKAVITGYSTNTLSTNVYDLKFWDILNAQPIGDDFSATNIWKYNNPENSPTQLTDPRQLVLDATKDLLPTGTLVDIWEFQIGESNGERLVRRFFSYDPGLSPGVLWAKTAAIRFGDLLVARNEVDPGGTGEKSSYENDINDIRTVERDIWGITGFDDPLLLADDGEGTDSNQGNLGSGTVVAILSNDNTLPGPNSTITLYESETNPTEFFVDNEFEGKTLEFLTGILTGKEFQILKNTENTVIVYGELDDVVAGDQFIIYAEQPTNQPSGIPINNQFVADIDPTLPGLKVVKSDPNADSERPVYVWHRGGHGDVYIKALIGQPDASTYPPIDILLGAPVDSFDDRYIRVVSRGEFTSGLYAGKHYIVVDGLHWHDLPQRGTLRTMTGLVRNEIWKYNGKIAFMDKNGQTFALISEENIQFVFEDDFGIGTGEPTATAVSPEKTTVCQLLHQEYSCPAVRLEFSVNDEVNAESVQLQVKAGILDMSKEYELDSTSHPTDDLVRGFADLEYAVSKIMTQQGFITSIETPEADPSGFVVYKGGYTGTDNDDKFNELEIMYRQGQIWVWWNKLLVTPDPTESAALEPAVGVNTPYFPVNWDKPVGKVAFRMFPGASMRQIEIFDRLIMHNEYLYGQLSLN